ncbi:MAG: hypothetical protein M1396_05400, partial [Chloroflexi bacterium]|nr:hypothetical protein [Chloroflexota bacterium]
TMTRRERMLFCADIVDMAVRRLLEGLDPAEKAQLARELLPRLLDQLSTAQPADTGQEIAVDGKRSQHSPEGS